MDLKARLAQISTTADVERQIDLARQYAMRLRTKAKSSKTLEKKVQLNEQAKQAEFVAHKLRLMAFDIEDAIDKGLSPSSMSV